MWWVWALVFGLFLTWGFEVRIKDFASRVNELEDTINGLKDDFARLRNEITGQMKDI